jgi:hypothetical protein
MTRNRTKQAAALLLACAPVLCACASSHPARSRPAARLEQVPGHAAGKIVLSAVGARRIGLQTQSVRDARASKTVVIPFSAVVYAPSGQAYAFVAVGRLAYTEVPITIDHVTGNSAYLRKGPRPGSAVVSTGAEELYGVQTGVLAQT